MVNSTLLVFTPDVKLGLFFEKQSLLSLLGLLCCISFKALVAVRFDINKVRAFRGRAHEVLSEALRGVTLRCIISRECNRV